MRSTWRQLFLFRPNPSNPAPKLGPSKARSGAARNFPVIRNLSSVAAVDLGSSDHSVIVGVLGKVGTFDEIRKELDGTGVGVSRDLVLKVLEDVRDWEELARRFFGWVREGYKEKVCSKGYNLMLEIMGRSGDSVGFWGLYEEMQAKGYGMSKYVRDGVLERFEDGLACDVEKLKELFLSGSVDNSARKVASRICKIVKSMVWINDSENMLERDEG